MAMWLGAAVLVGCASGSTGGSPGVAGAAGDTPGAAVGAAAPAAGVDPCSLLTADEIHEVIGDNSGPKSVSGTCSWENTDDYHSVTLEIGDHGTAVGGQLREPLPGAATAPGPDGIRFSSGNLAEFVIGDRSCSIQVVTSVSDESDRPTAVRLIGLVRQRLSA